MRLPDPRRSNAVLVGVGAYSDLAVRPEARAGAEDLAAVLAHPGGGGLDPERCVLLGEDADARQVGDKLAGAAAAAEDMLLFYFAGHGLLGSAGDLYLALGATTERRPGMTGGLRYQEVREIFRLETSAKNRIVILDCCYSGTVLDGGLSDAKGAVTAGTAIEGTAILTAVPGNAQAMIPQGEPYPAFTGRLIRLMSDGIEGAPELLDLNTLHWHLRREIAAIGLALPQARYENTTGRLALVRNRQARPAGPWAVPEADAPSRHAREARLRILGRAESILAADPPDRSRRGRIIYSYDYAVTAHSVALLHLAAALARDDEDHARQVMQQAVHLVSGEQLAPGHVSSVAQALAVLDPGRAERMVKAITVPGDRDSAMSKLSMALASVAPDRAEAVAHLVGNQERQDKTLTRLAELVAAADPRDAERIADGIASPGLRAEALVLVAREIAAADPRTAAQMARKALGLHAEPRHLNSLVRDLAEVDPAVAEDIARAIVSQETRERALAEVALKVAGTDLNHAELLAAEIHDPGRRIWAEIGLARGYSLTDPDRAERTVRAIAADGSLRVFFLLSIAGRLADSAPGHARRLLQEAQRAASTLDRDERDRKLSEIAEVAARLDADFGLLVAKRVADPAVRASALGQVARQVASTDPGRAARIARSLAGEPAATPYERVQAALIAAWLMAEDSPAEACQFLAGAHDAARAVSDLQERALALAELGTEMALHDSAHAWQLIDEAEAVARTVPGSYIGGTVADDTLATIVAGIIGHRDDAARRALTHHAERIARTIGYRSKGNPLNDVAQSVFADDPDRAERIALAVRGTKARAEALIRIAAMHADGP